MTPTVTQVAAVLAGLAIVASGLTATRRGLIPGVAAGVTMAAVAAVLITVARALG